MRSVVLLFALAAACRREPPPASVPPAIDPPRAARAPETRAPEAPQPLAAQGVTTAPTAPSPAPAAPGRARALRDVMRPESRAALDATSVPLLLPNDLGVAATAVVTSGERWVAASIAQGDHTVAIHATRETMAPPENPPVHRDRLRGVPATVTANEGVRVATWMEGGVAYMVDVECSRPSEDARCVEEGFIRALVEGLVRVEAAR